MQLDGETGKRTFVSSGTDPLGSLSPRGSTHSPLAPSTGRPRTGASPSTQSPSRCPRSRSTDPRRPGEIAVASYQLSGDASLTASINDATGHTVRQLANGAEIPSGAHTIRWDGFDDLGRPVADGEYTLAIAALDTAGQTSTASATVAPDGHGPTAQIVSPRVLPDQQAIAVRISDPTSGVARAELRIDGKHAAALPIGQSTLTYRPKTGWLRPSYEIEIAATDHHHRDDTVQHIHFPSQTIALDQGLGPGNLQWSERPAQAYSARCGPSSRRPRIRRSKPRRLLPGPTPELEYQHDGPTGAHPGRNDSPRRPRLTWTHNRRCHLRPSTTDLPRTRSSSPPQIAPRHSAQRSSRSGGKARSLRIPRPLVQPCRDPRGPRNRVRRRLSTPAERH